MTSVEQERVRRYIKAERAAMAALEEYQVGYLLLHGSQNYNLDYYTEGYESDFDFKAVIIPSLDEILRGAAKASTKIDYEYGQIDIKDIRAWEEVMQKGNPAYLEGLFTEYYWINPEYEEVFTFMREHREEYVRMLRVNMMSASVGMMHEKYKAMCHPYQTIKHKIDKWGYDGKQSSHLIRIACMLNGYFEWGQSYEDVLDIDSYASTPTHAIRKHKLNYPTLEEAKKEAEYYLNWAVKLKESFMKDSANLEVDYKWKYEFHLQVIAAMRHAVKREIALEQ